MYAQCAQWSLEEGWTLGIRDDPNQDLFGSDSQTWPWIQTWPLNLNNEYDSAAFDKIRKLYLAEQYIKPSANHGCLLQLSIVGNQRDRNFPDEACLGPAQTGEHPRFSSNPTVGTKPELIPISVGEI